MWGVYALRFKLIRPLSKGAERLSEQTGWQQKVPGEWQKEELQRSWILALQMDRRSNGKRFATGHSISESRLKCGELSSINRNRKENPCNNGERSRDGRQGRLMQVENCKLFSSRKLQQLQQRQGAQAQLKNILLGWLNMCLQRRKVLTARHKPLLHGSSCQ